jgi:hypothetical protein
MANIKLLDLLLETLTDARTNYLDKDKIDRTTFEEFNTIDTTANKAYIEKMCQFYSVFEISKEDIIDMFTRVIDSKEENPTKHKELKNDIFNKIKSKKDFDNFKDKVLDFKFKIPNIQQYKNSENAELVYEDSRFVIFRVLNFEGACEIGIGTTWCHADKSKNSYDEYKDKANYMFFDNSYPKNNPKSGFALSVDENGKIIELKSKNQKYKGEEHRNYPISYLTDDLGLDLKLFKYIKPSILLFINEFRDGLTVSIIKDKFSWLLEEDVNIKDAILGYKDDKLIWYDGEWHSGTWVNGIWYDGFWSKGTWEDGIWKKGIFRKDGIWKGGTFESNNYSYFEGKWYGGEWKGRNFKGEWLDPNNSKPLNVEEYKDGLTMDIITSKFSWLLEEDVDIVSAILGYDKSTKKLIWYSGIWEKGTWVDGIWKDGNFYGIWKGGIWLADPSNFYGEWKDLNNPKPINVKEYRDGLTYKIVKDKFPWLLKYDVNVNDPVIGYDKKSNKLIWYDGDWEKGTWKDGIWKRGIFGQDGIWEGGIFEGVYFSGKWYGGEWKGKYFWGEWLDPNNSKPINVKKYRDGLTYEIVKDKFPWLLEDDVMTSDVVLGYDKSTKKLIWYDGVWTKGTWVDGIWKKGDFMKDGIWKGGIFEDGGFYGKWYGGEWKGRYFSGEWLDPNNSKPE